MTMSPHPITIPDGYFDRLVLRIGCGTGEEGEQFAECEAEFRARRMLCSRCEERYDRAREATEDYHGEPLCAGCHDSIGESQDAYAAEEG